MNSTNTVKDEVVAMWNEAYAMWERGESVSPSAHDLARIANKVNSTLPDTDAVADAIYAAEQDGNDLNEVYAIVYG